MIKWKTMKQNNKNDPSLDDVISSIKDIMADYGPEQNPDQNNITETATKIQESPKEKEAQQGLSSADIMTKISGMLDEFKHQTKQYQKNISNTSIIDIINDMISPMIAKWIDANMEQLVEKVIKREIEQIKALSTSKNQ